MVSFWRKLRMTLDMIKFEHSVFALPFALTGALLALAESGFRIADWPRRTAWIVVAMVGARSVAMTFNRILDAAIDGRNRRTAGRHLPAGLLSMRFAWSFLAVAALVFFAASAALGPLCLTLSPVALGVICVYSYCKRFTSLSHLVLGASLGLAPAAAWIAMRGTLDWRIAWLSAAVMLWTAGFDIIYACQDRDFDRAEGLFSLPCRLGLRRALLLARLLHVGMVGCLLLLAVQFHLGAFSRAGIAAVVLLLVYEHSIVNPRDLSRIDAAFFTANSYVSVVLFVFWTIDIVWLWTHIR